MRIDSASFQDADLDSVEITLSRRNLEGLLAKLDGYPRGSSRTLTKRVPFGFGETILAIHAEENDNHYREAPPGLMHADTERAIHERRTSKY